jgi:hypothetical protein
VFVVGAGLIPLLCFDGQRASSPSEGPDEVGCAAPIASGDEVAVVGGAVSTIGGRIELPCGSETTIPARALQPEPDPSAALAVWPSDAAPSIELAPDPFIATKDELAAMTKIVADEVAGRYALPPRLEWTSGTLADIDGDGTLDRVVAAHEASMLYGIIVFFPGDGGASAGAGADPRVLSLLQFDRPRVIARSNLDGQPGEEIIVDSAFVEGIEDQTVTSAYSTRVIAWDGSQEVEVASWGCRMF